VDCALYTVNCLCHREGRERPACHCEEHGSATRQSLPNTRTCAQTHVISSVVEKSPTLCA
jgi:hypothetical protein